MLRESVKRTTSDLCESRVFGDHIAKQIDEIFDQYETEVAQLKTQLKASEEEALQLKRHLDSTTQAYSLSVEYSTRTIAKIQRQLDQIKCFLTNTLQNCQEIMESNDGLLDYEEGVISVCEATLTRLEKLMTEV